MTGKPRQISTTTTLHITLAVQLNGDLSVACIERRWKSGARDSGRIIHRGVMKSEARPGQHDLYLWNAGVYLQQLSARGVVTALGHTPAAEPLREPLGAVGGGSPRIRKSRRHAEQPPTSG